MQNNKRKRKCHWCWLLLLLLVVACTSKETRRRNMVADPENELMQIKNTGRHQIAMEMMPPLALVQPDESTAKGFYKIKLRLKSNEKIKGMAGMQYMNFGISSHLYAVQGTDTLPCIICERMPGINDQEYAYIALFKKPTPANQQWANLQLIFADTVAGFGTCVFFIKNDALKKLESMEE